MPSIAEPSATPVAATPIKKVSARKPRREDLSPEKIDELLARIPEGHPMYYDLRQIVLLGNSPDGYTVEEWLNLSMKFNFRTVAPKK